MFCLLLAKAGCLSHQGFGNYDNKIEQAKVEIMVVTFSTLSEIGLYEPISCMWATCVSSLFSLSAWHILKSYWQHHHNRAVCWPSCNWKQAHQGHMSVAGHPPCWSMAACAGVESKGYLRQALGGQHLCARQLGGRSWVGSIRAVCLLGWEGRLTGYWLLNIVYTIGRVGGQLLM